MDIEELTNAQVILLCILVSFVSAVATSVSVITLVEESHGAPVNTTINRVIERTVEKVKTEVVESEPVTVKVPVVSVSDVNDLSASVKKASDSIVSIISEGVDENGEQVISEIKGVAFEGGSVLVASPLVNEENTYRVAIGEDTEVTLNLQMVGAKFFVLSSDELDLQNFISLAESADLGSGTFSVHEDDTALVLVQGFVSEISEDGSAVGVSSVTLEEIPVGTPVFLINADLIGLVSLGADGEKVIHSLIGFEQETSVEGDA